MEEDEEDEEEPPRRLYAVRMSSRRTNRYLRRFIRNKGCSRSISRRPREMPMSDSATTTDQKVIKKWTEERDGRPATVRATEEDGHAGILRIDFRPAEDRLDEIEWDEVFRKFDESDLAFLYQDRTKEGELTRFHKFVWRE
jgi:hypothetical protein